MKILQALQHKRYLILAVLAAIAMMLFYSYTQVLFIHQNLDLWYSVIPLHNLILFLVFSALFGISVSYMLFLRAQPKTCDIGKSSTPGFAGTIISFFAVQCPACASIAALFLPIGAIGLLSVFAPIITLISIFLILFTLWRLGGFKR